MKLLKIFAFVLCSLLLAASANAAQRNLKITTGTVQTQKRVALVIGNAAYQGAPHLRNPVNDARAMSNVLNGLGFEVIEVTDATQKEMLRAITAFGEKLNTETSALFFYAGHGMQVKGKNYIIPVDAQIKNESAVASESVSVDTVLEQLNASPVSIIILDACRNNPFERSFRKMSGGGLAQMDAPKGSFIAYATAPGKTANDGDGKNGLFTQELLRQINEPGVELGKLFMHVRASVAAKSGDAQMPWDSSSMVGEFYFKPGQGTQVPSLKPVSAPAQPVVRIKTNEQIEDEYWEEIKNSSDLISYEQYRNAYPEGRYLNIAMLKLSQIKKKVQAETLSGSWNLKQTCDYGSGTGVMEIVQSDDGESITGTWATFNIDDGRVEGKTVTIQAHRVIAGLNNRLQIVGKVTGAGKIVGTYAQSINASSCQWVATKVQ
ncbi:MAG: caspase family protein [Gallionella sp.]|nr:caspase family protein [Gallionella sp.]